MVNKNIVFILVCMIGCIETYKFVRVNFNSNKLKIDGYYYSKFSKEDKDYYDLYFLYSNGIIYKGGSGSLLNKNKSINLESIDNFIYKGDYSKSITNWGVFKIQNSNIELQMRYPRADAPILISIGIIENDSTFIIKSLNRIDGSYFTDKNLRYHFRKYNPKPDSTNKFID